MINLPTSGISNIQWVPVYASLTGSLIKFMAGLSLGWASPSVPKLLAPESFPRLTSSEGSWVVSMLLAGHFAAVPIVAVTVDVIGRKNGILFSAFPVLFSLILMASAETVEMLYVARFFIGIGTGYGKTVIGMYIAEIAEPSIRGVLSTASSMMTRLGILTIFSLGPFVTIRSMALITAVFPVIMLLLFSLSPQSPYFLVMRGRAHEAKTALMTLRGHANVNEEFEKIQQSTSTNKPFMVVLQKLIFIRANRRALVITSVLFLIDQYSGMGAVISYSQLIFERAGSNLPPSICPVITVLFQLLALSLCAYLVDRSGRRPMLLISCAGVSISLVIITVYFFFEETHQYLTTNVHWLPLVVLLSYHLFFMLGIGCLPMTIQGELFTTDVRAIAVCLTAIFLPLNSLFVTKLYQILADTCGAYVAFATFAVCSVLGFFFVLLFVPETKGIPLEDVEKLWDSPAMCKSMPVKHFTTPDAEKLNSITSTKLEISTISAIS